MTLALTSEQILTAALTLPPEEREAVATQLLRSLEHPEHAAPGPEWAAEIERRKQDLSEGRVQSVPWDQVRDELLNPVKR